MKFTPVEPRRAFAVGRGTSIVMHDCARIALAADEQVTFVTDAGAEYDVARKSWGFYATPSLNGRLAHFGLRGVLVKSPLGKFYVWLVERDKEEDFQQYLAVEAHTVVCWLDDEGTLAALENGLRPPL
jgi:hypothetical protein